MIKKSEREIGIRNNGIVTGFWIGGMVTTLIWWIFICTI